MSNTAEISLFFRGKKYFFPIFYDEQQSWLVLFLLIIDWLGNIISMCTAFCSAAVSDIFPMYFLDRFMFHKGQNMRALSKLEMKKDIAYAALHLRNIKTFSFLHIPPPPYSHSDSWFYQAYLTHYFMLKLYANYILS
jgi:hypothetical protein